MVRMTVELGEGMIALERVSEQFRPPDLYHDPDP